MIKNRALAIAVLTAVLIASIGVGAVPAAEKQYTAYNLWFEKPQKVSSINYKRGAIIPAGTEITNVRTGTKGKFSLLSFTAKKNNRNFIIYWSQKYHPGKTVQDFKNKFVTTKTFASITKGLTKKDVAAIKSGTPYLGMGKKALLICYGQPPEHATFDHDAAKWTYWSSRFIKKIITFNSKGRIISIKGGV